jgi:thioesterase domain-containing protein
MGAVVAAAVAAAAEAAGAEVEPVVATAVSPPFF